MTRTDKLWSSHDKKNFSIEQSREELQRIRISLTEQLHVARPHETSHRISFTDRRQQLTK